MIIVTGSIVARSDSFDAVLALSREHVRRSRGEPGCLSHAVYLDVENPLRLVFFEEWANRAVLQAHFAVPASGAFVAAASALAAEAPTIRIYDAAAAA